MKKNKGKIIAILILALIVGSSIFVTTHSYLFHPAVDGRPDIVYDTDK